MSKFAKYLLYVLFAVSLVFIVGFFIDQDAVLDSFLYYAYILVGIAILSIVILPLLSLGNNPKGLKRLLMTVVLAVVFVGVSYALASSDPLVVKINVEANENTLKLTDAGLILTYILSVGAFIAIISGGIIKMVRNR